MTAQALIIVDVQNAMFVETNPPIFRGEEVLEKIRMLLETARHLNIPVIFIRHTEEQGLFQKGSKTWEIHPNIAPLETEPIIEKRSWDAFYKTNLDRTLKAKKVRNLVLAGMQTEFCLDTTCRSAFSHGYRSRLVMDAHTTFDSDTLSAEQIITHHNRVLGGRFVTLVPAADAFG